MLCTPGTLLSNRYKDYTVSFTSTGQDRTRHKNDPTSLLGYANQWFAPDSHCILIMHYELCIMHRWKFLHRWTDAQTRNAPCRTQYGCFFCPWPELQRRHINSHHPRPRKRTINILPQNQRIHPLVQDYRSVQYCEANTELRSNTWLLTLDPLQLRCKINAPTSAQACPSATAERSLCAPCRLRHKLCIVRETIHSHAAERSLCAPYVSVNVPSHQSGVFPAATANNDTVPEVYTDTVGHNA